MYVECTTPTIKVRLVLYPENTHLGTSYGEVQQYV